ncbi:GGDEF domain-containing protein [Sporolactobacillus nakayamae]|uniref:Diguanylate cyclase (GGDEF) domain-containing protein n=1 Tax=Sporolactobacillus nakayamae TaxID=269670 RepID=A0A1I2PIQ5_9BACL|nr:GGDEF domain-containing protein [Sporolactobacillus nakayamae]SFG15440.1 diguanylate cyclase (GGDEF) domain-containing protein [Sporolactobacillus nakayamae]
MNLLFDMKMFLSFLVTGNLVTVILIGAYLRRQRNDDTLTTFFYGKLFQTISWILAFFRNGSFDVVAVSLANSILFIGCGLEAVALLKLSRGYRQSTRRLYMWITTINVIGFNVILLLYNYMNIRVAFASVGMVALLVLPVIRMTRGTKRSSLMRLMGFLYFLLIMIFLGRAIVALMLYHAFEPGAMETSFIYSFTFITLSLSTILSGTGFILLLKEMTDRELVRLANYDDLTKTLNRRAFFEQTKQYLGQYAKKQQKVSFLLFDVDQFKLINDTYGHDIGDRVLRDLSRRIYAQLEADNLFSRFGGDEFAILMPGLDEEQSTVSAERIRAEIAHAKIHLPNESLHYTISIGLLTLKPDRYTDIENLYISCDNALYGAKKSGKNSVFRGNYKKEL